MSRYKSFCNKCSMYTMHDYSYDRTTNEEGILVTAVCEKCGNQVEEFKRYDE